MTSFKKCKIGFLILKNNLFALNQTEILSSSWPAKWNKIIMRNTSSSLLFGPVDMLKCFREMISWSLGSLWFIFLAPLSPISAHIYVRNSFFRTNWEGQVHSINDKIFHWIKFIQTVKLKQNTECIQQLPNEFHTFQHLLLHYQTDFHAQWCALLSGWQAWNDIFPKLIIIVAQEYMFQLLYTFGIPLCHLKNRIMRYKIHIILVKYITG